MSCITAFAPGHAENTTGPCGGLPAIRAVWGGDMGTEYGERPGEKWPPIGAPPKGGLIAWHLLPAAWGAGAGRPPTGGAMWATRGTALEPEAVLECAEVVGSRIPLEKLLPGRCGDVEGVVMQLMEWMETAEAWREKFLS
mmetsp:Transcript_43629/g.78801  ORF Transcript_43629/g.78801 Transcript_43629/m.78801 type:complete len:140 (-) Transcript_43629:1750-2169(-)